MRPLTDKVAIVTGCGHAGGIGQAIAVKLAEGGANVVVSDLPKLQTDLDRFATELREHGVEALSIAADIRIPNQIDACVTRTMNTLGRIDVLVNNAGVGAGSPCYVENTQADWDLSYQINLRGTALFCKAVLPIMEKQGGGVLINISSTAGLGATVGMPAPYVATKSAIVGLTKAIALEYGHSNIRAIAVCPGSVDTQMRPIALQVIAKAHQISVEEAAELENNDIALGRPAHPTEIADVVAYLVGPGASYVTGIALPVAGGITLGL